MVRPLAALLGALVLLLGWLAVVAVEVNGEPAAFVAALADGAERSHLPGLAARGYLLVADLEKRRLGAPGVERQSPAAQALLRHIVETRMAAARLLLGAGYEQAAEAIALEGARANFDDLAARALLLEIRLRGAQPQPARRELMLLLLKQEHPQLLCLLGNVFAREGNTEDAVACYQRALAATPEHVPSLLAYARLAAATGQPQVAADLVVRAAAAAAGPEERRQAALARQRLAEAPLPLLGPVQAWWGEHSVTALLALAYLVFLLSPGLWRRLRGRRVEAAVTARAAA